jgi:hypothetical protein
MRTRLLLAVLLALAAAAGPVTGAAKPKPGKGEGPVDEVTAQARTEFVAGTSAVKAGQWSEALAHFEKANALKAAPIVTFNIGYCQRALGRYVLARGSFETVLADPSGMPEAQVEETKTYVGEIDRLLAHVRITLDPPSARIAIDGRPLVAAKAAAAGVLVAGVAPAGEGAPPPSREFEVIVDPGVHLLQASRPGHADVLLNKTFAPGAREDLPLKLNELPASIHVESDQPRAVVLVDERDVGIAPVDITRPAGRYRVQVQKRGFVSYGATLTLAPGQKASLQARLQPETEPITHKWWFWGATAAVIAGGVTATYLLTRPEPQPPPYDTGTLGWLAQPR